MSLSIENNILMKNGKPFFYLADTCWSAFTNIKDNDWDYYLDYRKSQGFNTLQINILLNGMHPPQIYVMNLLKLLMENIIYKKLNLSYFEHADKMCARAKEKGFELALVIMWCNFVPDTWASQFYSKGIMPIDCIDNYINIIHETFTKYEPLYIISGDTDFNTEQCIEYYVKCAKQLKELAPNCLIYNTHKRKIYIYTR